MNKISVVVPCFNEEEVLSMFYKKTSEVLNEIEDITYELLFVDDGSKDHTKDILRALSLKDDHCEFISFSRNFGKEAAMFAGLKKSSGDYVVIMDADLQHPPVLLKEMYKAVSEEGYDCCAGKRVDRTGEGKIRNFLSHTFYKVMQKMCKMDMSDGCGDFRMMSRQIAYALEGMFSFSTAPIVWIGNIGTAIMISSIIMAIFGLLVHVTSMFHLVCLILFLSGLQMLFVAILGQYTTKDYMESKQRPIYIVKETSRNLS